MQRPTGKTIELLMEVSGIVRAEADIMARADRPIWRLGTVYLLLQRLRDVTRQLDGPARLHEAQQLLSSSHGSFYTKLRFSYPRHKDVDAQAEELDQMMASSLLDAPDDVDDLLGDLASLSTIGSVRSLFSALDSGWASSTGPVAPADAPAAAPADAPAAAPADAPAVAPPLAPAVAGPAPSGPVAGPVAGPSSATMAHWPQWMRDARAHEAAGRADEAMCVIADRSHSDLRSFACLADSAAESAVLRGKSAPITAAAVARAVFRLQSLTPSTPNIASLLGQHRAGSDKSPIKIVKLATLRNFLTSQSYVIV